jgi:hypothetical protein
MFSTKGSKRFVGVGESISKIGVAALPISELRKKDIYGI